MTVIEHPGNVAGGVAKRARKAQQKQAAAIAATSVSTEPMGRDLLVPLDRLRVSAANVRKVQHEDGLVELAALIESQGLLQRLSVVADGDGDGGGDGDGDGAVDEGPFAVVAGGRRLRAMQMLAMQGRWPVDQPIECKLYDRAQAVAVSLAENSGREGMHPADQMEAFRRLIEDGLTAAHVAGRFGVSVLTVERRLKLARLAPRFIEMYRDNEIDPDQLQALALLDDHAQQVAVWDSLNAYDRSAWQIRRAITASACRADDRLARFVGLDAYEAEGGTVRRDLFTAADDLSGMFLDNQVLLQTLAVDKLRGHVALMKEEGWSWVECSLDIDLRAWRSHGREVQAEREPTSAEAERIALLAAEQRQNADNYDQHQDQGDPDDDDYDAVEQRLCEALDEAEDRLMAARADLLQWSPAQLARAGAVVRLDGHGVVVVDRGLVRPEDRKTDAGRGTAASLDDEGQPRDDDTRPTQVKPEFSEKLMRDLTAHRTAAIQAALLQNPRIALVTLVHRMAETVFGLYGAGDDVVKVLMRVTGDSALSQEASDYASSPAAALMGDAETQWGDRLPGSPPQLFRWLLAQADSTLLELLAYCTARSVNAIAARPRGLDHSDAMGEALGIDMADWWVPTAANYLDHVSKAKALEAVKEATGLDPATAIAGMKKADVVAYCTSKLEGTRWLPSVLRSGSKSLDEGSIQVEDGDD